MRQEETHGMDEGVLAAVRRFPERQRAIEVLAASDESFQSACADLAQAEAALAGWQASTAAVREARCAEYRDLVEDLAREIEAGLEAGRRDDR
jgi:hypothetical protein